jgi:CheY-like chemotaxis protein
MHKRRILVIDDSEDIHKDFARILCPPKAEDLEDLEQLEASLFGGASSGGGANEAIELDSAFQGQEGLAKVQEAQAAGRPYALVFLDYRMPPGWNGYETLRHLHQVAPALPVVLCSAFSDDSWERMDKELAGAHVLRELRKPFDKSELQQLVRTLTGTRVS